MDIPQIPEIELNIGGLSRVARATPMEAMCGDELDAFASQLEVLEDATKRGKVNEVNQVVGSLLLMSTDLTADEIRRLQTAQRRAIIKLVTSPVEEPGQKKTGQ